MESPRGKFHDSRLPTSWNCTVDGEWEAVTYSAAYLQEEANVVDSRPEYNAVWDA